MNDAVIAFVLARDGIWKTGESRCEDFIFDQASGDAGRAHGNVVRGMETLKACHDWVIEQLGGLFFLDEIIEAKFPRYLSLGEPMRATCTLEKIRRGSGIHGTIAYFSLVCIRIARPQAVVARATFKVFWPRVAGPSPTTS
ncbi:MAG: hypothetical protein RLZZ416_133 [Candidatus Parcubacteria bacterium]|jgi:hypothetical protein